MLSEKLGCPVVKTVSSASESNGLLEVVKTAASLYGKPQKAPYVQNNVNLHDKSSVEAADRVRFDFVNSLVKEVEVRKVFTKDKNFGDIIDGVLTNKFLGIPIFAVIMYFVFDISQSSVGPFLADTLVGWIESFQGWAGSLPEGANPFLYALLIDGIIGGVGAVIGFLPLVMVMYFLIALLEDCGYIARATVVLDPIFKKSGSFRKICNSDGNRYRMCNSRCYGLSYNTQ